MSNFITEFNTWSRELLETLRSHDIDYATIELKTGVNYNKSTPAPVQVQVYTTRTQYVSGFDPEAVVAEVIHRINFSRQQEALKLAPPAAIDAEFEPVTPPSPRQVGSDDDIPF